MNSGISKWIRKSRPGAGLGKLSKVLLGLEGIFWFFRSLFRLFLAIFGCNDLLFINHLGMVRNKLLELRLWVL